VEFHDRFFFKSPVRNFLEILTEAEAKPISSQRRTERVKEAFLDYWNGLKKNTHQFIAFPLSGLKKSVQPRKSNVFN